MKQAWRTLGIKGEWLGWGSDLEHTCITERYAFHILKVADGQMKLRE